MQSDGAACTPHVVPVTMPGRKERLEMWAVNIFDTLHPDWPVIATVTAPTPEEAEELAKAQYGENWDCVIGVPIPVPYKENKERLE